MFDAHHNAEMRKMEREKIDMQAKSDALTGAFQMGMIEILAEMNKALKNIEAELANIRRAAGSHE